MANITAIDEKNFQSDVLDKEGVTVVRFWATWCPPCTAMKPVFNEIAGELDGKANFAEVDIDKAPQVANALGIRSVPTVVLFKNGQPVDGILGAGPKSQYVNKIQSQLLSKMGTT